MKGEELRYRSGLLSRRGRRNILLLRQRLGSRDRGILLEGKAGEECVQIELRLKLIAGNVGANFGASHDVRVTVAQSSGSGVHAVQLGLVGVRAIFFDMLKLVKDGAVDILESEICPEIELGGEIGDVEQILVRRRGRRMDLVEASEMGGHDNTLRMR